MTQYGVDMVLLKGKAYSSRYGEAHLLVFCLLGFIFGLLCWTSNAGMPTWEYLDAESDRWVRYSAEVENILEEAHMQSRCEVAHQSGGHFCVMSLCHLTQTNSSTGCVCRIRRNIISGGPGYLHDLDQLKKDKASLQAQLQTERQIQKEMIRIDREVCQAQLDTDRGDLKRLKDDNAFFQIQLAQFESDCRDLQRLKADKAWLQQQLETHCCVLKRLQEDKALRQAQLDSVRRDLYRLKEDKAYREDQLQTEREMHEEASSKLAEAQKQVDSMRKSLLTHLPQAPCGSSPVLRTLSADDPKFHALAEIFTSSMVSHRLSFKSATWCPAAVVSVIRIQEWVNPRRQHEYQQARWNRFQDTDCTPLAGVSALKCQVPTGWSDMNEYLLFHGTSYRKAVIIAHSGLDPKRAGDSAGVMFGRGVYFAQNASKSDFYTTCVQCQGDDPKLCCHAQGMRCVLVARVLLGESLILKHTDVEVQRRTSPPKQQNGVPYDSVTVARRRNGGVVDHMEFVVFDDDRILVQFLIFYKHDAMCQCNGCQHRQ